MLEEIIPYLESMSTEDLKILLQRIYLNNSRENFDYAIPFIKEILEKRSE